MHRSELLEDDSEPFEVLPGGRIGPSLAVALRVLFASDSEFQCWRGLEDALSPLASTQETDGGANCPPEEAPVDVLRRQRAPTCSSEEEHSNHGPASKRRKCCEPKQSGPDEHAAKRSQKAKGEIGSCGPGDCIAADNGSCRDAQRQGIKAGRHPEQLGSLCIASAGPAVLSQPMCQALKACILQRLQRYSMNGDVIRLEQEVKQVQSKGSSTESSRARVAALMLVLAEKQVLNAALEALARRG